MKLWGKVRSLRLVIEYEDGSEDIVNYAGSEDTLRKRAYEIVQDTAKEAIRQANLFGDPMKYLENVFNGKKHTDK